jgi:hypothetical protein
LHTSIIIHFSVSHTVHLSIHIILIIYYIYCHTFIDISIGCLTYTARVTYLTYFYPYLCQAYLLITYIVHLSIITFLNQFIYRQHVYYIYISCSCIVIINYITDTLCTFSSLPIISYKYISHNSSILISILHNGHTGIWFIDIIISTCQVYTTTPFTHHFISIWHLGTFYMSTITFYKVSYDILLLCQPWPLPWFPIVPFTILLLSTKHQLTLSIMCIMLNCIILLIHQLRPSPRSLLLLYMSTILHYGHP